MRKQIRHITTAIILCSAITALSQRSEAPAPLPNTPLQHVDLQFLAESCAPRVHLDTILAIAKVESGFHPYALSINHPERVARTLGYSDAQYQLARQPNTREEAFAWTRWLIQHGYTVSIGLMQVSSEQASRLHINDLRLLYDPCINIAAGAVILQQAHRGHPNTLSGFRDTFALYNSGSTIIGSENGYASAVVAEAPPLTRQQP
ncbi:MAG: transglycosylase SLT domain-containing protein [Terracidiphilus sp.]